MTQAFGAPRGRVSPPRERPVSWHVRRAWYGSESRALGWILLLLRTGQAGCRSGEGVQPCEWDVTPAHVAEREHTFCRVRQGAIDCREPTRCELAQAIREADLVFLLAPFLFVDPVLPHAHGKLPLAAHP